MHAVTQLTFIDFGSEGLEDIIGKYPIQDAPDFAEYLFKISKARLLVKPRISEHDLENVLTILRIARKALRDSLHPKARRAALHFDMNLLAHVLGKMSSSLSYDGSDLCTFQKRLLSDSESTAFHRVKGFMDFAGARRELMTARTKESKTSPMRCALESELNRAAYQEVRSRVLLAVGRILPAELADLVIEQALDVEEVSYRPVKPKSKEQIEAELEIAAEQERREDPFGYAYRRIFRACDPSI